MSTVTPDLAKQPSMSAGSLLIFIASFLTIVAEGVGFGVRTEVLGEWGQQFRFTQFELGTITGGGLVGFGVIIILVSLFLDRIGYKPVLIAAALCHLISGVLTLAAAPIFNKYGQHATFECLYWSMFLFAVGNGLCEGAVNPLVATLYPKQKTKYLNILHAGWPGGMIAGAIVAKLFVGNTAWIVHLPWEISMSVFMIPVLVYGGIVLAKKLPVSEARAAGVSFGTMLKQFTSPMLILLLLLMAGGGYVELGTDSWITNIMDNVIHHGLLLFIYTSSLMFILRFFAGPIVHRINPLGLLLMSTTLGFIGLTLLGTFNTGALIVLAATIYAVGKTFIWPTMLGVVGERFPKGGALVMGMMGGVGMLSAGLLGGPGIGYNQDYGASHKLQQTAPDTFKRYAAEKPDQFLFFPPINGLNNAKVGALTEHTEKNGKLEWTPGKTLTSDYKLLVDSNTNIPDEIKNTYQWWTTTGTEHAKQDYDPVHEANIYGGQLALRDTAYIHLTMTLFFLGLVLYFKSKGGYQQVHIEEEPAIATADM